MAAKIIDMTDGKDVMRAGFDMVVSNLIRNMEQHGLPQDGVDEIRGAVNKWYDSEINFDEIRPKLIDIYVQYFSADDLKQLLDFYQSPVGQKAIKNLPAVTSQVGAITQDYTKTKIPALNAALTPIIAKYRDQMQAASAAAAGGPGAGAPGGAAGPGPAPGPPGQ